jgi:hypothetical protein
LALDRKPAQRLRSLEAQADVSRYPRTSVEAGELALLASRQSAQLPRGLPKPRDPGRAQLGVTPATVEFLVEAAADGVAFTRTLTIGRQKLVASPGRIWKILREQRVAPPLAKSDFRRQLGWTGWADSLFYLLGASEVDAMDASDYEGATLIHDLNIPVPADLNERFDVVFDGGSLEHIFNVPAALQSYMEMVNVGGRLFVVIPANNYFGHGFYQFSAELFFRAFSEENGYSVERVLLCHEHNDAVRRFGDRVVVPNAPHGRRYEVVDPRTVGERISLVDEKPSMLFVQAKRIARSSIFRLYPQQSDYEAEWRIHQTTEVSAEPVGRREGVLHLLAHKYVPPSIRARVIQPFLLCFEWDLLPRVVTLLDPFWRRRVLRERSLSNGRWFRRVDP